MYFGLNSIQDVCSSDKVNAMLYCNCSLIMHEKSYTASLPINKNTKSTQTLSIIICSGLYKHITSEFHGFKQDNYSKHPFLDTPEQRVLNDLLRTRLSCGRMIRLLTHPLLPLSRQQLVSLPQPSCVSPAELTGVRGERRRRARSQIIRPRKSLSPELELLLILTGSQTPFSGEKVLVCLLCVVHCVHKRGG